MMKETLESQTNHSIIAKHVHKYYRSRIKPYTIKDYKRSERIAFDIAAMQPLETVRQIVKDIESGHPTEYIFTNEV